MTKQMPQNVFPPQRAGKLATEEIQELRGTRPGLVTGIPHFDELLYPLRSNICIIHGITNHGKSTLADIVAENNMPKIGEKEIIVKVLLEDTIEEQVIREASTRTAPFLSVSEITSGKMSKEQENNFTKAVMTLSAQPVWRIGNSRMDYRTGNMADVHMIFDAISWIRENQEKKIKLIVIDYFQRIKGQGRGDYRQMYVEQVEKIDAMAQGFGCPVLLLSQSSREANRQKRVPLEYDLSETKMLEDAARTIISVYRPHIHHGVDSTWDFQGQSIFITDHNFILLGIQKQKYKEAPVYRLFKSNEQRKMVKVDLVNVLN
jgi:replicative DNA helicase